MQFVLIFVKLSFKKLGFLSHFFKQYRFDPYPMHMKQSTNFKQNYISFSITYNRYDLAQPDLDTFHNRT